MSTDPDRSHTAILVRKYGGSSLASVERIREVALSLGAKHTEGVGLVVVVSAMGGTTDELDHLAREISKRPARRELDMLLSVGERITMSLLSMALADLGVPAISFTGSQCGLITDDSHTDARIIEVKGDRVRAALADGKVVVVAGFQGVSRQKEITTLGRGGSDATAVALAAALGAERCEILKDVDGVFTADPRHVSDATRHELLSYQDMEAIAGAGCGVVHARAVHHAREHGVPLFVGSSFHDAPGTHIVDDGSATPIPTPTAADNWRPLTIVNHEDVALLEISSFSALPQDVQRRLAAEVAALSRLAEWTRQNGGAHRWGVIGPARGVSRLRDLLPADDDQAHTTFHRGLNGISLAGPPPPSWLPVRTRLIALLTELGISGYHLLALDGVLRLLVAPADGVRLLQPLHEMFHGEDRN